MMIKIFDYFTDKLIGSANFDKELAVYEGIKINKLKLMIFAVSTDRNEILVAPETGGKSPISISFLTSIMTCGICKLNVPLGIIIEKPLTHNKRTWDYGLDLNRTLKIIKEAETFHKKVCSLIKPVVLVKP